MANTPDNGDAEIGDGEFEIDDDALELAAGGGMPGKTSNSHYSYNSTIYFQASI